MMLPLKHSLIYGLGFVFFVRHGTSQNWDGPSPYPDGIAPDVIVEDGWITTYPAFEGIEDTHPATVNGTDSDSEGEDAPGLETRDAKDFYLRILPLGASITQGVKSSDENGYRKLLRQQLRWKGWKVNMVGTKNDGTMSDNDNEGHPGWLIDQVHDEWSKSTVNGLKPNVVLINAGTNDCGANPPIDPDNAGTRMKSLIDDIYNKLPDVTIVMSTLVKSRDHRACAEDLSKQFRNLVKNDYRGKRMGLADIDSVIQMSQLNSDGIHPNDDGYKLFAGVWWNAISKLEGVIQPPPTDGLIKDDSSTGGADTCKKVAGTAGNPVKTQNGSGHDDGDYKHDRIERGVIESGRIQNAGDNPTIVQDIPINMYFADIIKNDPNSDRSLSLDDWIRVRIDMDQKVWWWYRQNLGGGKFGASTSFDPQAGMDCPNGSGYAFKDFNGDGLDDFFCIKAGASVSVALNRGGSPPKFESIGMVVPSSSGWDILDVQIGDIDGDGRADFCLAGASAEVKCSRNAGQGDKYSWQGFSTVDGIRGVVYDKGAPNIRPFYHFGDINGDYRADILEIGQNGNVKTTINRRGRGSGIVPDWVSVGITHEGQPETTIRNNIKFGKIYGSNRLDYIYIKKEKDYYDMKVWENKGSGGTKLKADGTFYCDMRGTGSDDYVWIYADGHSNEIFANTHNPPFWDPNYSFTLKVGAPRTLIHLADWTGNGRCDVLVQDKVTSDVRLWENQWNAGTKTLTFVDRGIVASPGCGKSTGVGLFDRSMRIADMDGDGRADVVCFELGGTLTSWLNTKDEGMKNVGQIKKTEGWDRANLRLADVENTGRADIIWVNKYTGAGSVWKNNGYAGPNGGGGGSSFSWTKRDVLYAPIDRGEVMNFANLGGRGRADLIQLYPTTNEAYTYFNKCPGGGAGGDDGDISDPQLPVVNDPETPRGDGDWPEGFPAADHWLALGDSYSAGVGAGTIFFNPQDPGHDCMTTTGSYPKRLERGYQALKQGLEFLSCSGDVMSNVNNAGSHGRATQLELMKGVTKGSYDFATLSIGGNDLGFSDIVIRCIMVGGIAGNCEDALKKAESIAGISPRDSAAHGDALADLYKVYRDVLDTAGDNFTLVVTGYAQFFATPQGNTDCNNGQIQLAAVQDIGTDTRPSLPLTVELRDRINTGVNAFNNMIKATVSDVQQGLERDNVNNKRIKFVDIDPIFEGHRFCEKGVSTDVGFPEFTNTAWFFSSAFRSDILPGGRQIVPRADDESPRLQLDRRGSSDCSDPYYTWDCALGELQARDPDMPLNEKEYPKGRGLIDILGEISKNMVMKAFHPKSIAYDAISKKIAEALGDESGGGTVPEDPEDPTNPGDTTDYYVWPEDGRDTKQVEEIASNLERYVTGNGKLEASNTKSLGLNYWRISGVTVDTAIEISNLTNVASVNTLCGDACPDDPTTENKYQNTDLDQLRYMSWPEYLPAGPALNRYVFDESAGQDVAVYVLDSGAKIDHPEFTHVKDRTRWIQIGKGDEAAENDCKEHGTAMLSLVAGATVGVAKNVNPVIVRMPCRGRFSVFQPPDWIDALSRIYEDLDASTPSVVLMASYWSKEFFKTPVPNRYDWEAMVGFEARHKALLDALVSKNAVLVTGSGNNDALTIDGSPASFGKPGDYNVPSLLVIGGVYADGSGLKGNTELAAGLPHAYGPAVNVMVASAKPQEGDPDQLLRKSRGTSCSSAMTAGLAAYYLNLAKRGLIDSGTSPMAIKEFIIKTSWSRGDFDGVPRPGIWNSVDLNAPASEWTPNTKRAAVLFRREFYA